jgi:hypothetical protein
VNQARLRLAADHLAKAHAILEQLLNDLDYQGKRSNGRWARGAITESGNNASQRMTQVGTTRRAAGKSATCCGFAPRSFWPAPGRTPRSFLCTPPRSPGGSLRPTTGSRLPLGNT